MASNLMHDGGSGGFRFDQNPVAKKPNYFKKLTQGHKKPAPKKSSPYGSGNLNKLVKKYNPPKKNYGQPAQNTAKKNNPAPKKKSTGGAVGQGGKVYKNGYVDSKGNKVVNGKWVTPSKKSTGVSKKSSSSSKSSTTFKSPAKVAPATVKAPAAPVKPKLTAAQLKAQREEANKKYLAGDTQYQNELGGLSDALSRYLEQNKADTGTLNRSYNSQVGKDGSIEKNRKKSQVGNSEGFAMRGMLRSGGYSDQATDINDTYKEQTGRVTDAYNDDKGRLTRASSAEKETVNQKREQARVAALSRKANQEILKAQASSQ